MNDPKDRYRYLWSLVPGVLTAVLSVPVWVAAGPVLGLLVGALGVACALTCRWLAERVQDVSEQKCYLDAQLIQSQKLAAIGELSSGIAHEINNPLAIIGQEVQWVRHVVKETVAVDGEHDAELEDSLREIGRQVERCREITHKLLDFARKKDPLIQGGDVNRLIEDMVKLVERETVQKNITIAREYQESLPELHTDHPLLRQVILNLLNNAAYAIGQDGMVTVRTVLAGPDAVDIMVTDTGCGIKKEDIDKIFDPFFTTKPPGKGTGLGLSICHGIIQRLGGEIRVESSLGKGTTFIVHLPLEHTKGESRS